MTSDEYVGRLAGLALGDTAGAPRVRDWYPNDLEDSTIVLVRVVSDVEDEHVRVVPWECKEETGVRVWGNFIPLRVLEFVPKVDEY